MKKSLRKKLSLSYIFVTMICVVLISILSNFFLNIQFKNYVIQEHERKNKIIVTAVNQQYSKNGKFNTDVIKSIGINAIENGVFISVKDASDKTIWNAEDYDNRKCEEAKYHLTSNMENLFPNWKGIYTKDEYTITNNANKVGKIGRAHV